jgi:membrane-associated phospholipid phosphatase
MVALGLVVGSGSTRIDGWFTRAGDEHRFLRPLLYFMDLRAMLIIFVVSVAVALYRRRWPLVAAIVLTPIVAVVAERLAKRAFGRRYDGALAYPSGHTTLIVILLGLAVIVAGGAMWTVVVAIVFGLLGLLGLSVTYHYFTDTIGGVLLGTSMLCLAALAAGLDRCQPRCDADHTSG